MKIGTRVAAGYGILIVLLLAVQLYQVSIINRMQRVDRQLSEISFDASLQALELSRDLDQLEEFSEKYLSLGDPGYGSQVAPLRENFQSRLEAIQSLSLAPGERRAVDALAAAWQHVLEHLFPVEAAYRENRHRDAGDHLPEVLEGFARLRAETRAVIQESRDQVAREVERSRLMSQQAQRVSWLAAAAALGLSVLVSFLIVRSISVPIRQLTQGTRRLREGDFTVSVGASGSDEMAQLARDFNIMVRHLNELDQLKKDFVSHVSHELKAPLASIQETTNILLEQLPGELNPKQARLLELNQQSVRRLSAMIANLLDLSRIEAGVMEYEFEMQDLVLLVSRVLEECQSLCREKQLVLKTDFPAEPVRVQCDGERVQQVVRNLLFNAVNFSPPQGVIEVRVAERTEIPEVPESQRRSLGNGGRYGWVCVADQGPGVPEEHREKIFQRFHQVKKGKKLSGQGTGLGLAISRSIVAAHSGALWVESNQGETGSTFHLLLPRNPVA